MSNRIVSSSARFGRFVYGIQRNPARQDLDYVQGSHFCHFRPRRKAGTSDVRRNDGIRKCEERMIEGKGLRVRDIEGGGGDYTPKGGSGFGQSDQKTLYR